MSDCGSEHVALMQSAFGNMPLEIIEYILMHAISNDNDATNVSLVCRAFHRLSRAASARLRTMLENCEAYDWYQLERSLSFRCSHAAVYSAYDKNMYIFGGSQAEATFSDLIRFNTTTHQWSRVVDLKSKVGNPPSARSYATLVALPRAPVLVLYGGYYRYRQSAIDTGTTFYEEMNIYDIRSNSWYNVHAYNGRPKLAAHAACMANDDTMLIYGGSTGSAASAELYTCRIDRKFFENDNTMEPKQFVNNVANSWSAVKTSEHRPNARYGHSMARLDDRRFVVVGGTAAPSRDFMDVWLLEAPESKSESVWHWREVKVFGPFPPTMWSYTAVRVGHYMVTVLTPPPHHLANIPRNERQLSVGTGSSGSLTPPRRKLITSRSLDEKDAPPSTVSHERRITELQRASSIPAIIVGEIPRLIVTGDEPSTSGNDGRGNAQEESNRSLARDENGESNRLPSWRGCAPRRMRRRGMHPYALDLSQAIEKRTARWRILPSPPDAPDERILYSMVRANHELIVFGGQTPRPANQLETHQNMERGYSRAETYLLRPVLRPP